ncbi:MAG: HAD family hydrolase [Armatimonadota bacterium]
MIKAVFFDLYETLISEIRAERPPQTSPGDLLGIEPSIFASEWKARQHKRMTGEYPDHKSVLKEICLATGVPTDDSLLEQIQAGRINFHRQLFMDVDPRVIETLEYIKQKGIRNGLISNASSEEILGFNSCPLQDLLDCVIFSCEAKYMKPDPEIYLIACERLGVKPEQCIFIGDGTSNELIGASEVGMTPYHATWFMERWPDDWRQQHTLAWNTDYSKLSSPLDLIPVIST